MKKLFFTIFLMIILTGCLQNYRKAIPITKVKSIHYDYFENKSYESGLENLLNDALVEETLADGTLYVADKKNADIIVKGIIHGYKEEDTALDEDAVPLQRRISLNLNVELYYNGDILPFQVYKNVKVSAFYNPDVRRDFYLSKMEGKKLLAKNAAKKILDLILYGEKKRKK